ncbi:MAG: glycoside hydrolase family 66 protein, partial [Cellulomonas sp.]|nr:glycoside hydrolase family 66 protein [Cellulomonas sp.]
IELTCTDGSSARTAVLVTTSSRARLRYGFVASYPPDKDVDAVLDLVRALHLDAVQLYDWAYRHADLVGGGEQYTDALDQPIALSTVRRLVAGLAAVGSEALGYAAVYAVGNGEWDRWSHRAVLRADGAPWALGDFLRLVDPAAPDWQQHLVADLRASVSAVGLHGFHLDQYGFPRRAQLADGRTVDLAHSFRSLIEAVRTGLPEARLVFNNVNDFPTWATADAPQDAVYVEVWPPHTTLDSLARVVTRARAAGQGRPVVIAAYQHVYDTAPVEAADRTTALTMATLFSHGATQLLAGESGHVLVDPYYVRNHAADPSTLDLLHRWYDFLVAHDELLLDPRAVEVTGAWVGAYNESLDVRYPGAPTSDDAVAGSVWRRVVEVDGRLVMHLINLAGQTDTEWDAPRAAPADPGPGTLRVRRAGAAVPRVLVADPDGEGRLVPVEVSLDGEDATATLPAFATWQLVVIDLDGVR